MLKLSTRLYCEILNCNDRLVSPCYWSSLIRTIYQFKDCCWVDSTWSQMAILWRAFSTFDDDMTTKNRVIAKQLIYLQIDIEMHGYVAWLSSLLKDSILVSELCNLDEPVKNQFILWYIHFCKWRILSQHTSKMAYFLSMVQFSGA